jgi:hypothetical protein
MIREGKDTQLTDDMTKKSRKQYVLVEKTSELCPLITNGQLSLSTLQRLKLEDDAQEIKSESG